MVESSRRTPYPWGDVYRLQPVPCCTQLYVRGGLRTCGWGGHVACGAAQATAVSRVARSIQLYPHAIPSTVRYCCVPYRTGTGTGTDRYRHRPGPVPVPAPVPVVPVPARVRYQYVDQCVQYSKRLCLRNQSLETQCWNLAQFLS